MADNHTMTLKEIELNLKFLRTTLNNRTENLIILEHTVKDLQEQIYRLDTIQNNTEKDIRELYKGRNELLTRMDNIEKQFSDIYDQIEELNNNNHKDTTTS